MPDHDHPVQPGHPAPDFAVASIRDDRTISLADYRGRAPVLLGLFRGMYCPFCRRAVAQMNAMAEQLQSLGVDSLAIVGSDLDNARLYFKYRPMRMTLAADPQLTTHSSYGLPRPTPTPEMMAAVSSLLVNPTGELPAPLPLPAAGAALNAIDGYQFTDADRREHETTFTQMKGQFLIDRDGIVRWSHIEGEKEGIAGMGKVPSRDEVLSAATTVLGNRVRQ
jgi:peroxiredoxin